MCVNGVLIPTFIPLGQHFEALFKSTTFRVEEKKSLEKGWVREVLILSEWEMLHINSNEKVKESES